MVEPRDTWIEDASSRRGIQSVEIGMRVLEALCDADGPMNLRDVAAAANLPTSNCHRYLVSFARAGFVRQDSRTSRYDLGPRMITAGLSAISRLDPIATGVTALEQLVDQTGYTGQLAIWNGTEAIIVRWIAGRLAVRTSLSVGAALPPVTSATGQIFLAYLPSRQTEEAVQRSGADRQAVEALVAGVRRDGMAMVQGLHIPGLSAAAVPLLDAQGEAVAAMCLIGLADGFPDHVLAMLREEGSQASRALGWQPDTGNGPVRHSSGD